jgi:hypothetical protein
MMAEYSFCESVIGIGPWHIRTLSDAGRKLSGGIDTPSLCGRVAPTGKHTSTGQAGLGGWDLSVPLTQHHLGHCCPRCAELYHARVREA